MTNDFSAIFGDARALWRANRDLLIRVGGVFLFLPAFAMQLFLPPQEMKDVTFEQAFEATVQWAVANAHWLLLDRLVSLFGLVTLLMLLLARAESTLGETMRHALRRFPAFVLLWLLVSMLTTLGAMAFIVPGLYLAGRTFLIGAALIAEPERGPAAAFSAGIEVSRGRGWMLFLIAAIVWLVALVATGLAGDLGRAFDTLGGPIFGGAVGSALSSVVSTAAAIAMVLLQVAAYRRLAAPRQGI
ncbi:hypothetical protein [Sphingosinithalassobacter portus]|uniref:hypothetical protein n=1 Tax=Stakelama portus TaxID=2676234 RepID=UPI000D6E37E1|nr:hypothetical protein [Sphingosinithalassobacter portus]